MPLVDSKIFRGDDTTLDPKKPVRKERKIWVYIPSAFKDGAKAPILVMHDGPSNLNLVRNGFGTTLGLTVPEPSSLALFTAGVICAAILRRRAHRA